MILYSLLIFLAFSVPMLSFSWNRNREYNEEEAKLLFNLSASAYSSTPETCIQKTFPENKQYQVLHYLSETCDVVSTLCSGYVLRSDVDEQFIIVFRGSETNAQILLEGWAALLPGEEFFGLGHVNRYFMKAHQLLWENIQEALSEEEHKHYQVAFTGHSLGAALATLAVSRTVVTGLRTSQQVRITTFGEPRVGNVVFARNFDRMIPESYRVVFRKDIVPHSPGCIKDHSNGRTDEESKPCDPDNTTRPYHHGIEIWYPDCMDPGCPYKVCTGEPYGEDFSCSDQYKFDLEKASSYIWDHRHYFGVLVTEYGSQGCDNSFAQFMRDVPNTAIDKVMKGVKWVADKFGINL